MAGIIKKKSPNSSSSGKVAGSEAVYTKCILVKNSAMLNKKRSRGTGLENPYRGWYYP
jgi:hypothetical protein